MRLRRQHPARPGGDGIHEPNMTPLIDVSLVLVVILMVATPLAFQSGIAVNAASASGRAAAQRTRADRIELDVLASGQVRVNRTLVPRDHLAGALAPLVQDAAGCLVVVRCDDGVRHGDFVSVLDTVRGTGATRIAVVGD